MLPESAQAVLHHRDVTEGSDRVVVSDIIGTRILPRLLNLLVSVLPVMLFRNVDLSLLQHIDGVVEDWLHRQLAA